MTEETIIAWNSLSTEDQKDIFQEAATITGLPTAAVEKDWWVSLTLQMLFELPFAEELLFKGGTSLSKGWNLIERFSEDIDLAIDRRYLGFEGDLSNTQVKKLKRAACTFVNGELYDALANKITSLELTEATLKVQEYKDPDTDPLNIELIYKSLVNDVAYLQPRVLIETGARSLMEPTEERTIQSIVGRSLADHGFVDQPFAVATVLPKRTFLEKAFLLHEEFQKPLERIKVNRLSRHLYDLDTLAMTQHGRDALEDTNLYQTIIKHRQVFNKIKGIDYTTHLPGKIDFVPPEGIIQAWKEDYLTMQANMIHGESKPFDQLIQSIMGLREKFRAINF